MLRPVARAAVLTLVGGLVITLHGPAATPGPSLVTSEQEPTTIQALPVPAATAQEKAAADEAQAQVQESVPTAEDTAASHVDPGKQLAAQLDAQRTSDYGMVGVTWDDPRAGDDLQVLVRAKDDRGWSEWTELHNDAEEGPAAGQESGVRGGTDPLWVGPSGGVQVRVFADAAAPQGLRVDLIDPGSAGTTAAPMAYTDPSPQPRIITRKDWGANESYGDACWQPLYGKSVHAIFIHHTAGSNDYTRAQSAGIVRGIYAYHTQSRGWCDIGYNFLVDRFGTIYEGRRGGIDKPVRGSHAGEANLGSVGISLMGNFQTVAPTVAMRNAVVNLVSWEVGNRYLNPLGTTTALPDQPRNKYGKPFAVISGHRDAMYTACPGQQVYNWLPTLRRRVAARIGSITSPIEQRWERIGGAASAYGQPFTVERPDGAGRSTQFDNGTIYWSPRTPARGMRGAIRARYEQIGGTGSALGFPRSAELDAGVPSGRFNILQRGGIYWSRATGVHWVFGGINAAYNEVGGAVGIGLPTTSETDAGVEGGRMNSFQSGDIYWSKATGPHAVYGAVRAAFRRAGAGPGIGLPTGDETDAQVAGARMQAFQTGTVFWSRSTGAHPLYGAVLGTYLRMGAGASDLGLPTSDEYSVPEGRQQDFEGGSILWDLSRRRAVVTTSSAK